MTKKIEIHGPFNGIVDMEELLKGIKLTKDFVLNKYEGKTERGEIIEIDNMTFSLIGHNSLKTLIRDGGIVSEFEDKDASARILIFSYGEKIVFDFPFTLSGFSLFSSKTFYRDMKNSLINSLKPLVDDYSLRTVKDNMDSIYAFKEDVVSIEKQPHKLFFPKTYKDTFVSLSEELYQEENIYSITFTLSTPNNFEVYVDNNSEIVQYNSYAQIHANVTFLNKNSKLVSFSESEYIQDLESIEANSIANILKEKIFAKIEQLSSFAQLSSGTYPILMKQSASNVFFHEALAAHLLSGTYISEGLSTVFKNRLFTEIPSLKGVDVIMDPTIKGGFGSYLFDHEGVPTKSVTLIKDGKIVDYLTDRYSAARLEEIKMDKELIKQLLDLLSSKVKGYENSFIDKEYVIRNFESLEEKLTYLLSERALENLILDLNANIDLDWRKNYRRVKAFSNGHSRVENWFLTDMQGNQQMVYSEARMSNLLVKRLDDVDAKSELIKLISDEFDFYLEVEAFSGYVSPENGAFVVKPETITKVSLKDGTRKNINPGEFSMNLEDFLKKVVAVGSNNMENRGFCGASSGYVPVGSYTPDIAVLDVPYAEGKEIEFAERSVFQYMALKEEL